jgi:hypothetical protein
MTDFFQTISNSSYAKCLTVESCKVLIRVDFCVKHVYLYMMNRREMIFIIQNFKINKTFLKIRNLYKISTSISETGMTHMLHYEC